MFSACVEGILEAEAERGPHFFFKCLKTYELLSLLDNFKHLVPFKKILITLMRGPLKKGITGQVPFMPMHKLGTDVFKFKMFFWSIVKHFLGNIKKSII